MRTIFFDKSYYGGARVNLEINTAEDVEMLAKVLRMEAVQSIASGRYKDCEELLRISRELYEKAVDLKKELAETEADSE